MRRTARRPQHQALSDPPPFLRQALERELSFVKERARRVEEEKQEASATADELREELAETRHGEGEGAPAELARLARRLPDTRARHTAELRSERERGDARLKSAKETEERASALAEERHRAYEETTLALQSERERREELEERQERTEAFLADVLELNEQLVRRSSRGKARCVCLAAAAAGGGGGGRRAGRSAGVLCQGARPSPSALNLCNPTAQLLPPASPRREEAVVARARPA